MISHTVRKSFCTFCLMACSCLCGTAVAQNLAADYAFLVLTTISPEFAAANYTINNESAPDVEIAISRLPYRFDLMANNGHTLQLEVALAFQKTRQTLPTFPNENIDARWTTYGANLGLLYNWPLADHLHFTPSLRVGAAHMVNDTSFNGDQTNQFKDLFSGIDLNWQTYALVTNLGLGLSYDWSLRDRTSHLDANVYHVLINTFRESDPAVAFSERANMLTLRAELIIPTNYLIAEKRLDAVLLFGTNTFFGENRNTLGYTTSYQIGIGGEWPIHWANKQHGYFRIGGQLLWAENMQGWLVIVGFNPG